MGNKELNTVRVWLWVVVLVMIPAGVIVTQILLTAKGLSSFMIEQCTTRNLTKSISLLTHKYDKSGKFLSIFVCWSVISGHYGHEVAKSNTTV